MKLSSRGMSMSSSFRRRPVAYRGNAANSLAQRKNTCIPRSRYQLRRPIETFPSTEEARLAQSLLLQAREAEGPLQTAEGGIAHRLL